MKVVAIPYSTAPQEQTISLLDYDIVRNLPNMGLAARLLQRNYMTSESYSQLLAQRIKEEAITYVRTDSVQVSTSVSKILDVPRALCAHIWHLCHMSGPKKVCCVKLVHDMYALSLNEAKQVVDYVEKGSNPA